MQVRTDLLVLVTTLLLAACHKNSALPPSPTPPPVDSGKTTTATMNINLKYAVAPGDRSAMYELVISEPGGKVLLDTIAAYEVSIKAVLRTNYSLLDVTTVDTILGRTGIYVYKSVDPSTLSYLYPDNYFVVPRTGFPPTTAATVVYNNIPSGAFTGSQNDVVFADGYATSYGFTSTATSMKINYNRIPGASLYLAFPHLGIYKLAVPATDSEVVDLSHMDTALKINFPRAFAWSPGGYYLTGVTDSSDRKKDISFLTGLYRPDPGVPDLLYPKLPVQAYELNMSATDAANNTYGFYNWGKDIPAAPVFLNPSIVTVNSNANNNFSIRFNSPVSYYTSEWRNTNNVSITMAANPDSTNLNPVTTLTNQKCKFLSGINFSNVTLSYLHITQTPNFRYAGFLNYCSNQDKVTTHQLNTASTLTKKF